MDGPRWSAVVDHSCMQTAADSVKWANFAVFSLAALVACNGSGSTKLIGDLAGGTSGGGTSAVSSSTGGAIGTGGGTTGSSVGTTGGVGCGADRVWVGDTCAVTTCQGQGRGTVCVQDGGLGGCFGQTCHVGIDLLYDTNNCGDYGNVCPTGLACEDGECYPGGIDCSFVSCPIGTACTGSGCALSSCANAADDLVCGRYNESYGEPFCCQGNCIESDANDCGGCGVHCAQ